MYGRGACDMKAGLALTIGLLDAAVTSGIRFPMDIVAIFTVDEEAPDMLGAHQIVADGLVRPHDQILAPEPIGDEAAHLSGRAPMAVIAGSGPDAHAGRAHLGVNAVHINAEIVHRLHTTFVGFRSPIPSSALLASPAASCPAE